MLNSTVIQALSFYVIPIIVGVIPLILLYILRLTRKELNPTYSLFSIFDSFVVGAVTIYVSAIFINKYSQTLVIEEISSFLPYILLASILVGFLTAIYKLIKNEPRDGFGTQRYETVIIILSLFLLSAGVYEIWRYNSPNYTTLNWDLYHHQTLTTEIKEGAFSIKPSDLSDSFQFNGYTTIFHTLLAIPQKILNTDILGFWYHLELFHLYTTILASFLVGYSVSKSRKIGCISAIVGAFVFESIGAYTSLFLIPQNLDATIGAVLIARTIYKFNSGSKHIDAITIFYILFIIANHLIIGSVVMFLFVVSTLYLFLADKFKSVKFDYFLIFLSLLLLLVVPVITKDIDLSYINRGEAEFFNFNFYQKWLYIRDFYGYLFVLLPFGFLYAIKKDLKSLKLATLLAVGSLTILFATLPYTLKLYAIGRYFVNAFIAIGFWQLIKNYKKLGQVFYVSALFVVLLCIFVVNIVSFKQVPSYKEIATHVTPNEIQAAEFIKSHYKNKNALIISDPATMHVLDTLSTVNSPAGAYATLDTRKILHQIYISRDSRTMGAYLYQINDLVEGNEYDQILLVVGKRFEVWQNESIDRKFGIQYNVWKPYDLTIKDQEYLGFIDYIRRNTNFKEVFKNNGVVIFEINKSL